MALVKLKKELVLAEDLDVGMGDSSGSRQGKQINAQFIPYGPDRSVKEEIDSKFGLNTGDLRYARLGGSGSLLFSVAPATEEAHATNKQYVDNKLADKPSVSQVVTALEQKADKHGSDSEVFKVNSPTYPALPQNADAVNYEYVMAWFTAAFDVKADKASTLDTITEHTAYIPTKPMHPATKDYVDNAIFLTGAADMTIAEYVAGDKAVAKANAIGDIEAKNVLGLRGTTELDINKLRGTGIFVIALATAEGDLPATNTYFIIKQIDAKGVRYQEAITDTGMFYRMGTTTVWQKLASVTDVFQMIKG